MKKLTVCLVIASFAFVTSLQAGEKSKKTSTSACSTTAAAACSTEKVSSCSATEKVAKVSSCSTEAACGSKKSVARRGLVKGAVLLALR